MPDRRFERIGVGRVNTVKHRRAVFHGAQYGQTDAGQKKQTGKNAGGARQSIAKSTSRHQAVTTAATANAQRPALRALQAEQARSLPAQSSNGQPVKWWT